MKKALATKSKSNSEVADRVITPKRLYFAPGSNSASVSIVIEAATLEEAVEEVKKLDTAEDSDGE